MFPVWLINSISEGFKFSFPITLGVVIVIVFDTVIVLNAVTVNLLIGYIVELWVLELIEFTGCEKITVPELAPAPVVSVVIFT
jgi:hypothetical protein